jgi:hypothetical protein
MKNQWTDQKIEKALKALRTQPADSEFWKDRVWSNIESKLPAQPQAEANLVPEKPWFAWMGLRRLALAAACLMVVVGGWRYHQKSLDEELNEYLCELAVPVNVSYLEPEDALAPDLFRGPLNEVQEEDPVLMMEGVYESI